MIKSPLAHVVALLARFAFWRQPDAESDLEEITPAEKAALLAALNPDHRLHFRDESGCIRDVGIDPDSARPASAS